jgi:hypothetical protein
VCVFPGNQFRADIVPALADVASRGAIRIVDMAFVRKDAGGSTQTLEINDLDDDAFNAYSELLERTEGLLSDSDVQDFADRIRPDSAGALIVFEHVWANQLIEAVGGAQGEVAAQGFVPAEVVEEMLQARLATA